MPELIVEKKPDTIKIKRFPISVRERWVLITLFSVGVILETLEASGIWYAFEFGELLTIFCIYYTIVFVRISSGLNLSRKRNKIILCVLCWSVYVFYASGWLPFLRSIMIRKYVGGFCAGLIKMAFYLFIIEILISFLFSSHSRQRIIIILIILALVSGYSTFNASSILMIKEFTIPVKKLPKSMSGFTIVQLSDLHIGNLFSEEWLKKVVEKTNHLNPDLIVMTGDISDITVLDDKTQYIIDYLSQLKAKYGIIAVTGNHEYYEGVHTFPEITEKAGIRVLKNESVTIGEVLQIVGINDPHVRESGDKGPDLEAAMKNIDPNKPIILLSHRPKFFDEAVKYGVDLQLSGHWHGGQPPPGELLVGLIIKYSSGLYKVGDSYIYTSNGTGLYGVPMRLFTHNEITKIVLTSAL